MSYDLFLLDPVTKEILLTDTPHQMRGGTYALGGTTQMRLNVTYNYGEILRTVLGTDGIRWLYGKTGLECIPVLTEAISKLGDDVDPNYWTPTEGNVKQALIQLLTLSKIRPDGVWDGD